MRAVAAFALISCAQIDEPAADQVLRLPVASPELKTTSVEREYVAEIRAVRHAEIRSRFKGVLEAVSVDDGQLVKAGDLMFTINARALRQELLVARASILAAEAELETAQLELGNTKLLQEKNVVSQAEVRLAESKVQTLRAKVAGARATADRAAVELGFAEIRAPFDGVVNRVPRKAGSGVAEDELLTTISDVSEVHAYFRITEREYLEDRAMSSNKPRTVSLALADHSRYPERGIVDAITGEFDRATGTLAYRARFPNANGLLKHGSSGKVILETELHDVIVVPQKSTFDVQGNLYVFVLDAGNVARARKIEATRIAESFVVERGLAKGDRFVLEGVQKVKDGMRIEVATPEVATPDAGAN
jgi:membrane fusion protein (multidrug efflux system)